MRKLSVVILLLLFTAIQLGTLAWYFYKPVIHVVCYQFFRHYPDNRNGERKLVVIKTNLAGFRSARQDENEILWKGELYDITKIISAGNEVTLTVEKDVTENRWMNIYNAVHQQIAKNKSSQSPAALTIYQWMLKWYIPAESLKPSAAAIACTTHHTLYVVDLPPLFFPNGPCQPPDPVG